MFVVDDMNDMVGPLGDRQAITPNLDRLAREGVLFRNAHAPGVFCAPSRTAIWTGLHASTTGCYDTEIFYYDYPELVSMQMAFDQAGYNAYGAGKLYHHRNGHVDLRGWKEYFTRGPIVQEMAYEMNSYHMDDIPLPDPYPYSILSRSRGNTTYSGMEWGPIPDDQAEDMAASLRTNWVVEQLGKRQDKPFFMALGLYIPHFPNYVPQKYLDLYDPEAIEPPVYNEYDLDDVPPAIRKRMLGRKRQHDELIALGALQESLQAWYASITFADAMLGRVLDALEASPYQVRIRSLSSGVTRGSTAGRNSTTASTRSGSAPPGCPSSGRARALPGEGKSIPRSA
jgi:arylsulfatase A-like enzyme